MAEPYVLTMGEIDALEERYTPVPEMDRLMGATDA